MTVAKSGRTLRDRILQEASGRLDGTGGDSIDYNSRSVRPLKSAILQVRGTDGEEKGALSVVVKNS